MYHKELIPHCIAIGISYDDFWHMNPRILKTHIEGHKIMLKENDMLNWMLGRYFLSATSTALDNGFNGKKAKSKYIECPIMSHENYGLTEEEIQEKQLQKMIDFEMSIIKKQQGQ